MREAQAASALDHPNICTIYEIDNTPDGQLFIAMGYYEGETLKQRISKGPLPIDEALDITTQIAQGLSEAHAADIIHRDIKPANVMITKSGLVKIVDFGIAKLLGVTGPTQTGTTLGTVSYMSPEQITGEDADQQSDVWSLGAVLYEMLTGQPAFKGENQWTVMNAISNRTPASPRSLRADIPVSVERAVTRALEKPREKRFGSAEEFLADTRSRLSELTQQVAERTDPIRALKRPAIVASILAAVSVAVVAGIWTTSGSADERRAREELIPEITRLAETEEYLAAYALAEQAEQAIPDDATLGEAWSMISAAVSLQTTPSGADVYFREFSEADSDWTHAGQTPLEGVRLPRGLFQLRIEASGFQPQLLAAENPGAILGNSGFDNGPLLDLSLIEEDRVPSGMVPVPGGRYWVDLGGLASDPPIELGPFLIDKHEVSNQQFKEFVDAGGYETPRYWAGLQFVDEGRELSWDQAMAEFTDSTGQPGPLTWELGNHLDGQGDYPVTGVSWYEAVAYANFKGNALPTLYHWARAATTQNSIGAIVTRSNFSGTGRAPVGSYPGVGPYGTYDTAGNAREWVSNRSDTLRWILGGAWNEPNYTSTMRYGLRPFDRSPINGFRTVKYLGEDVLSESLTTEVLVSDVDDRSYEPVSDELFEAFAAQFRYDRGELNERIEWSDDGQANAVRQRITFDAGYENDRTVLHLFLPNNAEPPYQTIVYSPGAGTFEGGAGPSDENLMRFIDGLPADFVVKSGRALAFPILDNSFERYDDEIDVLTGAERERAIRGVMAHWRQDLGRTLDYLETREDAGWFLLSRV